MLEKATKKCFQGMPAEELFVDGPLERPKQEGSVKGGWRGEGGSS